MDSINLDKWRELTVSLFLAYLDCYSKLSKNSTINKKQELANSINKISRGRVDIKEDDYGSAYTIAREIGIFCEDGNGFSLSKSAMLASKEILANVELAYQNYLKRYAFNSEFLIDNKVVHPLSLLLDNFQNNHFTLEEASDLTELIPINKRSSLATEHVERFLKRLISAGILNYSNHSEKYYFNNWNDLKNSCQYSHLTTQDFIDTFINDDNYNNMVTQMIDRGLTEDSSLIRETFSKYSLNTIFYGPAGTGKTYTTVQCAVEIIDGTVEGKERSEITSRFKELKDGNQISFVTFHQSFSYEEFVEGISVTTNNETKQTEYKIKDGIFKQVAETAILNPNHKFVLIIDEINRGNVSKIFGELITLLESSKRLGNAEQLTVKLPYTQEEFGVPNNLYIIGTMNSSDRSLTALDVAMRRRFKFQELLPEPQLFQGIIIEDIEIQALLEALNERIEYLIGRDYCIGHAYFTLLLNEENQTFEKLADILKNQILPLLQEYFYSDWEKIDLVLGCNNFVYKNELQGKSLRLFENTQVMPEEVWNINTKAFDDPKNYIKIYKDIELEGPQAK